MNGDIRCPTCGRLLARRDTANTAVLVVVSDRAVILVREGEIKCQRCGVVVVVMAQRVERAVLTGMP